MSSASGNPISEFFSQYERFVYNPSASFHTEFQRLCSTYGWGRKNPERKEAKELFQDALVRHFNQTYGNNLESWQLICQLLSIQPLPDTMKDCQRALETVHVNIFDLLECHSTGATVHVFATEEDLGVYSRTEGKIFPKQTAKAGAVLKFLLRHINDPGAGKVRKKRRRKRRGKKK